MSRLPRHEAHSRSLAKAVTWRCTATIDTFVISYIVTGKVVIAGTIAATDFDLLFPRAGLGIDPLGSPRSCFPGPRMKAKSVHARDEARRIAANIAKLAGAFAEAVIRSVELIVQPGAKDAVGEMAVRCDWRSGLPELMGVRRGTVLPSQPTSGDGNSEGSCAKIIPQ